MSVFRDARLTGDLRIGKDALCYTSVLVQGQVNSSAWNMNSLKCQGEAIVVGDFEAEKSLVLAGAFTSRTSSQVFLGTNEIVLSALASDTKNKVGLNVCTSVVDELLNHTTQVEVVITVPPFSRSEDLEFEYDLLEVTFADPTLQFSTNVNTYKSKRPIIFIDCAEARNQNGSFVDVKGFYLLHNTSTRSKLYIYSQYYNTDSFVPVDLSEKIPFLVDTKQRLQGTTFTIESPINISVVRCGHLNFEGEDGIPTFASGDTEDGFWLTGYNLSAYQPLIDPLYIKSDLDNNSILLSGLTLISRTVSSLFIINLVRSFAVGDVFKVANKSSFSAQIVPRSVEIEEKMEPLVVPPNTSVVLFAISRTAVKITSSSSR